MPTSSRGWLDGAIGVLLFSGSLPATKLALTGFDPMFLTVARAAIAGVLSIAILRALGAAWPQRRDLGPLLLVACGVVVGFPLLTALALTHVTSARGSVFIGLLPLATAAFAVLRGGERPRPVFWLFSIVGAALVSGYALGADAAGDATGDVLMLAAIVVCGLGYAEGARLSRHMGGLTVIAWALVLSLPLTLVATLWLQPAGWAAVPLPAWAGLAYVSLISMLIGFVFWYRGLARGGIAVVGQIQLLQPFFAFFIAAAVLGEPITWPMLLIAAAVALCVAGARRFGTAPAGG